ncbi:PREDICTED: uncharacterized protein LOC109333575 [Lupinus angustifolius]|uniref:uncharacterized protein LOC109333575 n=1 Tax=Lupinus angustifolius TaxID=3871 RepID=UPI00092EE12D|nr:PREDICTED: uncharacterized protein LOC109333575 [Lupinus angustifolius]
MGGSEDESISDLKQEIIHKFKDFMTGIAKLEELGTAGSKLLSGFQRALEFIRRPPIDTNSKLVNKIIEANETKRVKSYVNSGCRNPNDGVQSVTSLNSCKHGLLIHISEAQQILNKLEGLLGDVTSTIQRIHGKLLVLSDHDVGVELNEVETYNDLDENGALSSTTDVTTTKQQKNTDVTHLATLMAILYSMVKQDYLMQERVVSALDLKLSSEELESYCQMWSLCPFINDETVRQAWELIR